MEQPDKQPTYAGLLGFLIPLAFIPLMMGIGRQFINAGMARMPEAKATLAAFGLAIGLVNLFSAPLMQTRQAGLVLVDSRQALRAVRKFVLLGGLVPAALLAILVLTPVGRWIIEDVHRIDAGLAPVVLFALMCFIPLPFVNAQIGYQSGILVGLRRPVLVTAATLAGIGVRIVAVFVLLTFEHIRARPILLPIFVSYAGVSVHLVIVSLGVWYWGRHLPAQGAKPLRLPCIFNFYWPLALVMLVQGGSRPLINMFVARGSDGTEALAVLAVVFPLANLPYGWVNVNRSMPAAFRDFPGSRGLIRRFAMGCGLFSFAAMIILFWTPLRTVILESWIGLKPALAGLCAWPLIIFAFFPLTVMVRAHFQGIGLVERRTKALTPSALSRLAAILLVLVILSFFPLRGALKGVVALLCGFIAEAIVVRVCVRRRPSESALLDP